MINAAVVAAVLVPKKIPRNRAILAITPAKIRINQKNATMAPTAIVGMKAAKIANALMDPIVIAAMISAKLVVSNKKNPAALSNMG